jgi:phosphohistidine phosphatase
MKFVYLVRHGKSAWPDELEMEDIDRPLKVKGIKQVKKLALKLIKKEIYPDLICSSTALRSVHTALIMARSIDYPENRVKILPELYGSDVENIIKVIEKTKEDYESIMIFGHDPSLTNFANQKTKKAKEKIPTASVVGIEFDCDNWVAIRSTKGKQRFYIKSKD